MIGNVSAIAGIIIAPLCLLGYVIDQRIESRIETSTSRMKAELDASSSRMKLELDGIKTAIREQGDCFASAFQLHKKEDENKHLQTKLDITEKLQHRGGQSKKQTNTRYVLHD